MCSSDGAAYSQQIRRSGVSGELARLDTRRRSGSGRERGPSILVVENEENNRHLMEHILHFAGYSCVTAENGLEALDLLERAPVALVLLDLSMPVMDGYRTAELIRQCPATAVLPVVAVSAHAMSEERELALRCGCTEYLTKPFRPQELLDVIERLLSAS